jgi:hypothetical protein
MMLDAMVNVVPVWNLLVDLQLAKDARQGAVPPKGVYLSTQLPLRHEIDIQSVWRLSYITCVSRVDIAPQGTARHCLATI